MTVTEAIRVLREQTLPMLRETGGSGHAEAVEALLSNTLREPPMRPIITQYLSPAVFARAQELWIMDTLEWIAEQARLPR